jgi:hypothetical protein
MSSESSSNSRDVARNRNEELKLVRDFWIVVIMHLDGIPRRELFKAANGQKSGRFPLEEEERKI